MSAVVLAVAFVVMEPVTYLVHRYVMHGPGRSLHRSHHRSNRTGRFEANDVFPLVISLVVMAAMAVGYRVSGLGWLVPAAVGVTLYGLAYTVVHDVYTHGRLVRLPRVALLDRLASAHRVHHRFGGEPYGMLLPYVPDRVRERAAARERAVARSVR